MAETVQELLLDLQGWSTELPFATEEAVDVQSGERHGSHFVAMSWPRDGILRIAEIAITNPTDLNDELATEALVSVRAAATTPVRWTSVSLYQQRRMTSRVTMAELERHFGAAVEWADSLVAAALRNVYELPFEASDEAPDEAP